MILHDPFKISARLLPALEINDTWISLDGTDFIIDNPNWTEKSRTTCQGRVTVFRICSVILSTLCAQTQHVSGVFLVPTFTPFVCIVNIP